MFKARVLFTQIYEVGDVGSIKLRFVCCDLRYFWNRTDRTEFWLFVMPESGRFVDRVPDFGRQDSLRDFPEQGLTAEPGLLLPEPGLKAEPVLVLSDVARSLGFCSACIGEKPASSAIIW